VKLILARHGRTEGNVIKALDSRPPGMPLDEVGRAQAEDLARRLAAKPVAAVYASRATRAQQTAAPVAAAHDLSVVVLDNAHFGETGMQMSHSGLGAKLEMIAAGAGFPSVSTIETRAALDAFRPKLHDLQGPHFVRVAISTDHVDRALPPRDGVFLKNRLRGHLGFPVS